MKVLQERGDVDTVPGRTLLIIVILIVSARWVVPWFLYHMAKQKSCELFVFTVASICFTVAWIRESSNSGALVPAWGNVCCFPRARAPSG